MRRPKQRKPGLLERLFDLHRQVFLRTMGSWGPVTVDEKGNLVEDQRPAADGGAQASPKKQ